MAVKDKSVTPMTTPFLTMLRLQMTSCSYMPINLPLGKLGLSLLKDLKFHLPIPHVLLFAAGGYCVMSMHR